MMNRTDELLDMYADAAESALYMLQAYATTIARDSRCCECRLCDEVGDCWPKITHAETCPIRKLNEVMDAHQELKKVDVTTKWSDGKVGHYFKSPELCGG